VPPKTWIQAGIMLVVGIGGLYSLVARRGMENSNG